MERREFLQSLICAGVAAGLPLPVGMGLPQVEWAVVYGPKYGSDWERTVHADVTFPDGHRQVFRNEARVSGTMLSVARNSADMRVEMGYQCAKRANELSRDIACANRERLGLPANAPGGGPLWREDAKRIFATAAPPDYTRNWT